MSEETTQPERPWWQDAVIYEIAPISFQDSDADGKGDLPGLLSRVDHLRWLGIDAVWLTPVYTSPFRDFGYDISDFCAIDPCFGSLAVFDRLVAWLHESGIRLILDLVPNHTSADHDWFKESAASRDNAKADWFLWADPADNGGPPNNWVSRFGGSAWEWNEVREQYYYHSFLVEQPDLNWRSPAVRDAIAGVMRFWLARGVDGFRVDASAVLIKDRLLRDNPPDPEAGQDKPPPQRQLPVFTDDRPEAMACIEHLRSVVDEFGDRLLCGEVQGKTDRIGHFYGSERPRLQLPLNFALLDSQWTAHALQATIDAYYNALPDGAWPVWVIGGHDKPRVAGKLGEAQARVLAMLLLTLRGTPFLFMGDELGMAHTPIPDDRVVDPFEKLVGGYGLGRDPERVPLRWDDSSHGGFTAGEPWLPQGDPTKNVARLKADPSSLLHLYRALMALRRRLPCLGRGDYHPIRSRNDVLAYRRTLGSERVLVLLNLVHEPRKWDWDGQGECLLSTHPGRATTTICGPVQLQADEGVIVSVG
jgi:alpha-glucosidase